MSKTRDGPTTTLAAAAVWALPGKSRDGRPQSFRVPIVRLTAETEKRRAAEERATQAQRGQRHVEMIAERLLSTLTAEKREDLVKAGIYDAATLDDIAFGGLLERVRVILGDR